MLGIFSGKTITFLRKIVVFLEIKKKCFSTKKAQNIEGQYRLKGNPLTNISMEQIIDCDGTQDTVDDHADCGVFGGWPFLAFEYVIRAVN